SSRKPVPDRRMRSSCPRANESPLADRSAAPAAQAACAADHFPFAYEGFRVRRQGNGSYRSNEDCALPASRRHGAFTLVFGGLVMTRRSHFAPALAALALAAPGTAPAQEGDPTLRDSFSIGEQGGSLCEVQATVHDRVTQGMFDRAWTIVCRDASQPVGTVRALRASADAARARIERARTGTITCAADGACTVKDSNVAWTTRIEA